MDPMIVLASIIALGVVYVMLPTGLATFLRYRLKRLFYCPIEGESAVVQIDERRAGLSAAARGYASLRVKACSFWPKRAGCAQKCLSVPGNETAEEESAVSASPSR